MKSISGFVFCSFLISAFLGCNNNTIYPVEERVQLEFGLEKVFQPPQLSGSFQVGTQEFHWIDSSRGEPHTTDESDFREVLVRVFYPADSSTNENQLPVFDMLRWQFWFDAGGATDNKRLRRSNYTESSWPVYHDSTISQQQGFFPLMVMSHGYGFSPEEHIYIAAEFASRGYIVASINHPYGSSRAVFPDGRQIRPVGLPEDNLGKDLELWAEDQVFVIQQMQELNQSQESFFFAKLDMSKVITTGHSYGGAASFHSAWLDDRVRIAIDIDGTIFNINDRIINIPFMFIQSGNGDSFDVFDQVANDGYNVAFEQRISHHSFADYVMFWQSDFPEMSEFGSLSAETAMFSTVNIMEQFIDKYLHQEEAPLLDNPEQIYDFTRVRIFED
ncbi:MAG: hypothetical protein OQJ89_02435 [Kangiellaceae bacterium]|nr:hypothetical protein [Kangiellaceae bacterium]MCW9000335.1 hypothetical protein [Kangiellaceae bacterium]MCW9015803.1 hypothetical protein [Kangiellaceae bacterium]